MGYQEIVVKLKPDRTEKTVLEEIKKHQMNSFVDFLGHYYSEGKAEYLVFATDRHPGGDFLVKNFEGIQMEKVIKSEVKL